MPRPGAPLRGAQDHAAKLRLRTYSSRLWGRAAAAPTLKRARKPAACKAPPPPCSSFFAACALEGSIRSSRPSHRLAIRTTAINRLCQTRCGILDAPLLIPYSVLIRDQLATGNSRNTVRFARFEFTNDHARFTVARARHRDRKPMSQNQNFRISCHNAI